MVRSWRLLAAASMLAGCGSGGGGAPPAPVNRAPTFTSAAGSSVVENQTAAYQATATDPDGDPISFSIAGGADAARFAISAAGALTFVAAPDFEAPADSGANNVYDVVLAVTDGRGGTASLTLQITVTNSERVILREVLTGFGEATQVVRTPGANIFIAQRNGNVTRVRLDTGERQPSVGPAAQNPVAGLSTVGEGGLLGLAFGPDGYAFLLVTTAAGNIEVRRYIPNSRIWTPVHTTIRIPHPGSTTNYGGWIGFGPDGYLYIATGDGGGTGDPAGNAQNRRSLLGKVLRIDPRLSTPGVSQDSPVQYAIPADNPFADGVNGAPEVWAYGFRNPHGGSFSGSDLLLGDIGEGRREEINLIRPADRGGNYGWPFREGTLTYAGAAPAGLINPVLEYAHGTGPLEGTAVTGGTMLPTTLSGLGDRYLFGDFQTGALWTAAAAALVQGQTVAAPNFERRADFRPDVGTLDRVASFWRDTGNVLWVLDYDGQVFRAEVTD